MKKKGFVRTIEALIAIIMSFVFLVLIMPTDTQVSFKKDLGILAPFEDDEIFRGCVLQDKDGCLNDYIKDFMPAHLEHKILITNDSNENIELPEKRVFVESLMFAGNISEYSPKIVKIFYWSRD